MTDRKFYYREFHIRVVSPEPVDSVAALQRVLDDAQLGVWCSHEPQPARMLDGRQAADELKQMGATPPLFGLDDAGNDLASDE